MLKHVVVLAVAVLVALGMAQQVLRLSSAHASAPLQVAAPATPEVASSTPAQTGTDAQDAQINKASDGHYWAEAEVNGRWIHCLIDTGATTVALTRADAERLGLDIDALSFNQPVNTANGQTQAAHVNLDYVSVAGARVAEVPAVVVKDGLSTSLLGMSYLGKLSRFEATPTSLILRP
jgi:aspartyl protease family protein